MARVVLYCSIPYRALSLGVILHYITHTAAIAIFNSVSGIALALLIFSMYQEWEEQHELEKEMLRLDLAYERLLCALKEARVAVQETVAVQDETITLKKEAIALIDQTIDLVRKQLQS